MADEVVSLDLQVRLEGAQSVQELKQILKDAKNEAIKFGEGTPQFEKFMKVAANAADTIGDLNEGIKALDPGAKAAAFQALGSTIVGGMQAATGALAVFSGDNEELNAILLKSMAIVQGLQGIQAIADAKKQLGFVKNILGLKSETAATQALAGATTAQATATGVATTASKIFRTALIATGVGALVVAVGLLIANFDKVKKVVTDLFPVLNNLGKITDQIQASLNALWQGFLQNFRNIGEAISLAVSGDIGGAFQKIFDFQSIAKAATKGYHDEMQSIADEAAKKELQKVIDANKNKLKVFAAQGKDTYALQRKIFTDELSLLEQNTDEEKATYQEKLTDIKALDAAHKKELNDAALAAKDKKDAQDKVDAQKEKDRLAALEDEKKKIREKFAEDKLQYELTERERELLEVERKKQEAINAGVTVASAEEFARIQKFDINQKYNQQEYDAQQEANKKSEEADKASNDRKIADEQRLREAKLSLATSIATGITNIGILMTSNAKKQEAFNKVAAGIQIGIDTARGITSAVAAAKGLTGFDYVAQVALGVGSVLANAAKAKQLLSKVGASVPSIDTSAISSAAQGAQQNAPSFNPANQRTTLEEAERRRQSGGQGETMQKVYIVSSELTEKQNRLAALKDRRIK